MATTTKKRTATAKKATTAPTAKAKAKAAAPRLTERSARELLRDGIYAAVGAGDSAVALVRTLPEAADKLRAEAPKAPAKATEQVKALREQGTARVRDLEVTTQQALDGLATRGRQVVTAIKGARPTKRAVEQTRVARSQVKAAATSVRKAVGSSADAVDHAADKVGEAQAS